MNFLKLIILVISLGLSVAANSQTLENGAYILTHPSRHYQTGKELIAATNNYLHKHFKRGSQIIGLYQVPIEADPLWYARPLTYFSESYYSHGGEHDLRFPKEMYEEFHLALSGGYLSACLGRTASNLIYDFLRPEVETQNLELRFYSRSVFTGFLDKNGRLEPESPYWESISDFSIDGLSFAEATRLVPPNELKAFMLETMQIALLKKAPLSNRAKIKDFNIIVKYPGGEFYLIRSNTKDYKTIIARFVN